MAVRANYTLGAHGALRAQGVALWKSHGPPATCRWAALHYQETYEPVGLWMGLACVEPSHERAADVVPAMKFYFVARV